VSGLERQIGELMDRYDGGENYSALAGVLEEYLGPAYSDTDHLAMFEVNAWAQTLAEDYLVRGRVDDAFRVVLQATDVGEGAEMMCDLAERLMRSGHEPIARGLWDWARAGFGDDAWVYVQAGIEYADLGEDATALTWLTPGIEVTPRTWDPQSALEQLVPMRAGVVAATGQASDDVQTRAAHALAQQGGPGPTTGGPQ
jgi:hypothetical protein